MDLGWCSREQRGCGDAQYRVPVSKGGCEAAGDPFREGVPCKSRGVMGTIYSWGDSH